MYLIIKRHKNSRKNLLNIVIILPRPLHLFASLNDLSTSTQSGFSSLAIPLSSMSRSSLESNGGRFRNFFCEQWTNIGCFMKINRFPYYIISESKNQIKWLRCQKVTWQIAWRMNGNKKELHFFSKALSTEMRGFEPRRRLRDLPHFECGPFNHLGTSP